MGKAKQHLRVRRGQQKGSESLIEDLLPAFTLLCRRVMRHPSSSTRYHFSMALNMANRLPIRRKMEVIVFAH